MDPLLREKIERLGRALDTLVEAFEELQVESENDETDIDNDGWE